MTPKNSTTKTCSMKDCYGIATKIVTFTLKNGLKIGFRLCEQCVNRQMKTTMAYMVEEIKTINDPSA